MPYLNHGADGKDFSAVVQHGSDEGGQGHGQTHGRSSFRLKIQRDTNTRIKEVIRCNFHNYRIA